MSHLIKANSNIKGISVHDVENILSQFADDTALYTEYSRVSIEAICQTLQVVERNIGLKISYEKTSLYRIGSIHKSNAQFYMSQNLHWSDEDIYLLGVHIACDGSTVDKNFQEVLSKVKSTLSNRYNRTATLLGKVLIVKSLIGSLFVYKTTTMSNLSSEQIKCVEKEISNFLWSGRRAQIAMHTLQKQKIQGGLKLVDLSAKQRAIKIKWIVLIEKDEFLHRCAH